MSFTIHINNQHHELILPSGHGPQLQKYHGGGAGQRPAGAGASPGDDLRVRRQCRKCEYLWRETNANISREFCLAQSINKIITAVDYDDLPPSDIRDALDLQYDTDIDGDIPIDPSEAFKQNALKLTRCSDY